MVSEVRLYLVWKCLVDGAVDRTRQRAGELSASRGSQPMNSRLLHLTDHRLPWRKGSGQSSGDKARERGAYTGLQGRTMNKEQVSDPVRKVIELCAGVCWVEWELCWEDIVVVHGQE